LPFKIILPEDDISFHFNRNSGRSSSINKMETDEYGEEKLNRMRIAAKKEIGEVEELISLQVQRLVNLISCGE
jgi:hypothetical protein